MNFKVPFQPKPFYDSYHVLGVSANRCAVLLRFAFLCGGERSTSLGPLPCVFMAISSLSKIQLSEALRGYIQLSLNELAVLHIHPYFTDCY